MRALIVIGLSIVTAYADLSEGLLARYPLKGNLNDASGNKRHAVHSPVDHVEYKTNQMLGGILAFSFATNRAPVYVPDFPHTNNNFTLSVWFLRKTPRLPPGPLIRSDVSEAPAYGIYASGRGVSFVLIGTNGVATLFADDGALSPFPHHVVAIRDRSEGWLSLYLDGVLREKLWWPNEINKGGSRLEIGATWVAPEIISDVRIWRRAITPAEVVELYAKNQPNDATIKPELVVVGGDTKRLSFEILTSSRGSARIESSDDFQAWLPLLPITLQSNRTPAAVSTQSGKQFFRVVTP